jgi:hypothetical protein
MTPKSTQTGLGIGGREDNFAASGLTMAGRGRRILTQAAR